MQISSLNKVITLLIVGGAAMLWLGVLFWKAVSEFALKYKELGNAAGAVVAGLLLVAGSALLGSIIEGLTDITTRRLVKRAHRRLGWARLFGQAELHNSVAFWEGIFIGEAKKKVAFRPVLETRETTPLQLAAGMFYKYATKEHVDWVVSHYSTYYLATNYLVLFIMFAISVFWWLATRESSLSLWFGTSFAFLVAGYSTWSLAVDRYLYTYLEAFRFAVLCLDLPDDRGEKSR